VKVLDVYSWWGRHPRIYDAQDWVTFLGRHRAIREHATKSLQLRPGDRALEIACGTGRNFSHILNAIGHQGTLLGVDVTPEMLESARTLCTTNGWNVDLILGDIIDVEIPESAFDGILCVLGMSAMPDHRPVLDRCKELLRPGGILSVCDACLFPGRLGVLNPLVRRVYVRSAAWDPDRDIPSDMERVFGNVNVRTFNFGSMYVAVSCKS